MTLVTAYEMPRTEPVIVAVADQEPENNAVEHNGGNCGVPPTASKPVKAVSLEFIGFRVIALIHN